MRDGEGWGGMRRDGEGTLLLVTFAGRRVTILIDEVNEAATRATVTSLCEDCSEHLSWCVVPTRPSQQQLVTILDRFLQSPEKEVREDGEKRGGENDKWAGWGEGRWDHLIAIERAGRARDGCYYTMRQKDISR